MIKAVILDVDGVIVGDKIGINFPLPHHSVIEKLKQVHQKGIPVILCTSKFNFAIRDIITQAALRNPHITDSGALIINPLENKVIKKHVIKKTIVKNAVLLSNKHAIYSELYTPDSYYIQDTQVSNFTKKRTSILQMEPTIVSSLVSVAETKDVIKIIAFATDDSDKTRVENVIKQLGNKISNIWSLHPYTLPARACVITALHVSKEYATKETIKALGLTGDTVLGIGDTFGDWHFMELCKYVATLKNGDDRLKELVKTKGEGHYMIAPSIDDNGIFDILTYFSLTN